MKKKKILTKKKKSVIIIRNSPLNLSITVAASVHETSAATAATSTDLGTAANRRRLWNGMPATGGGVVSRSRLTSRQAADSASRRRDTIVSCPTSGAGAAGAGAAARRRARVS